MKYDDYTINHNPKYMFGSVFLNPQVRKALLVDKKGLKLFAKMMSKKPKSAFNFINKQPEYYKGMLSRVISWHALLGGNCITKENIDEMLSHFINQNEIRVRKHLSNILKKNLMEEGDNI
jgi:hypothetical protein